MRDQPVSFDDFKVLGSSNSEFHLKIKESLLISRDQLILNKNEASLSLYLFDQLQNILQSYMTIQFHYSYIAIYFMLFSVIKLQICLFTLNLDIRGEVHIHCGGYYFLEKK